MYFLCSVTVEHFFLGLDTHVIDQKVNNDFRNSSARLCSQFFIDLFHTHINNAGFTLLPCFNSFQRSSQLSAELQVCVCVCVSSVSHLLYKERGWLAGACHVCLCPQLAPFPKSLWSTAPSHSWARKPHITTTVYLTEHWRLILSAETVVFTVVAPALDPCPHCVLLETSLCFYDQNEV